MLKTAKRERVEATKQLAITIKDCHKEKGVPGDMNNCVFGLALQDHFGDTIQAVEVGKYVMKVFTPGRVTLYRVPKTLRNHLTTFDTTKMFVAPPGEYVFLPYRPAKPTKGRNDMKNPNRGGKWTGKRMPTRKSTFEK